MSWAIVIHPIMTIAFKDVKERILIKQKLLSRVSDIGQAAECLFGWIIERSDGQMGNKFSH